MKSRFSYIDETKKPETPTVPSWSDPLATGMKAPAYEPPRTRGGVSDVRPMPTAPVELAPSAPKQGVVPNTPTRSATFKYEDEQGKDPVSFLHEMGSGAYQVLVETLTPVVAVSRKGQLTPVPGGMAPVATLVDQALKYMGQNGFLDNPSDATGAVVHALTKVGVDADTSDTVNQLATDIGKSTFQAAIMMATMFAAGPSMAGLTAENWFAQLSRDLAKHQIAKPTTTVISGVGSAVGGPVAKNMAGGEGVGADMAEIAGSMFGGGAGLITAGKPVAKAVGGAVGSAVGGITGMLGLGHPGGAVIGGIAGAKTGAGLGGRTMEMIQRAGLDIEQKALLQKQLPQDATTFAREAVEGDIRRIENTITKYVAEGRSAGDPQLAAEKLQKTLKRAYGVAQKKASQLWGKVDMTKVVPPDRLKSFAVSMLKNHPITNPSGLPTEIIKSVLLLRKGTTMKDMQGLYSEIQGALRENIDSDTLRRNLNQLADATLNVMVKADPADRSLITAREYTRWLHDTFSRGPVGAFIGRGKSAASAAGQGALEAADAMIRKSPASKQIIDAAQRLDIPQLEQEATGFIRNKFTEIADGVGGPGAGAKFIDHPVTQRFLRAFPKHSAQLSDVSANIKIAMTERKALEASAFKQFSGKDTQAAVHDLFIGSNKEAKAHALKLRFADDVDDKGRPGSALQGFKNGVVSEFFINTKYAPTAMKDYLAGKDIRLMMTEVLGDADMKRLDRMVETASKLEIANKTGKALNPLSLFSRYFGAGVARRLGAKTIQQTATGAALAEGVVAAITSQTPATDLLVAAVTNPKWERILYGRLPSNLREMQRMTEAMRTLLAMETASTQLLQE